jgi:hypothetical protein
MATMGADEFIEHMADYLVEPFGPERGDIRHAQLCAMIAAANGTRIEAQKLMPFDHQRETIITDWHAAKAAFSGGK